MRAKDSEYTHTDIAQHAHTEIEGKQERKQTKREEKSEMKNRYGNEEQTG